MATEEKTDDETAHIQSVAMDLGLWAVSGTPFQLGGRSSPYNEALIELGRRVRRECVHGTPYSHRCEECGGA